MCAVFLDDDRRIVEFFVVQDAETVDDFLPDFVYATCSPDETWVTGLMLVSDRTGQVPSTSPAMSCVGRSSWPTRRRRGSRSTTGSSPRSSDGSTRSRSSRRRRPSGSLVMAARTTPAARLLWSDRGLGALRALPPNGPTSTTTSSARCSIRPTRTNGASVSPPRTPKSITTATSRASTSSRTRSSPAS